MTGELKPVVVVEYINLPPPTPQKNAVKGEVKDASESVNFVYYKNRGVMSGSREFRNVICSRS